MQATIDQPLEGENPLYARTGEAQSEWARTTVRQRLPVIRNFRHLVAEHAEELAAAAAMGDRSLGEKLISEVLPLADACRWLEKSAARTLAPRRSENRGRPLWIRGVSFEVQRQPFGRVLVIGPGSYPLFLPAIHSLHALVAGNAVWLKPAPGTQKVALLFAELMQAAGLEADLLTVLPEHVRAANEAIRSGVDKVIFTGSSENGRTVLTALASTNTPSVMELSGEDTVIVLTDADLDLVRRAIRFGLELNGARTCIAPRRIIAEQAVATSLRWYLTPETSSRLEIIYVTSREEIVNLANAGSYGLGASIFSRNISAARSIAAQLDTGFVTINDIIVPTADPRMPFGGVKASGFGTTRGAEGLLEMTHPHVVAVRRGGARRHLDQPRTGDAKLFNAFIRATHGRGLRRRLIAGRDLLGAVWNRTKDRPPQSQS